MKRIIVGLLLIATPAFAGPVIAPNISADGVTLQMRASGELFCASTGTALTAGTVTTAVGLASGLVSSNVAAPPTWGATGDSIIISGVTQLP